MGVPRTRGAEPVEAYPRLLPEARSPHARGIKSVSTSMEALEIRPVEVRLIQRTLI
jgi:hypothetical protein